MTADHEPTDSPAGDEFDDVPERASEIDDSTDSFARPGGDAGSGGATGTTADDELTPAELRELLAERTREAAEFKELAQRIQADFDNYRKRAAAQSLAEADRASGRLAEALLPVLDSAEAAYVNHPDEVGPLLNQMLGELRKHGLETMDLAGKPFDPELAEAVSHQPGDGGEPVVVEVFRSGYLWKGKVLRAAMVVTKD